MGLIGRKKNQDNSGHDADEDVAIVADQPAKQEEAAAETNVAENEPAAPEVIAPSNGDLDEAGDPSGNGAGIQLDDPAEGDDEDVDDSLMDVFTSEAEEDVDLSAMTQRLEDVDARSLLAEAMDIAASLHEAREAAEAN